MDGVFAGLVVGFAERNDKPIVCPLPQSPPPYTYGVVQGYTPLAFMVVVNTGTRQASHLGKPSVFLSFIHAL